MFNSLIGNSDLLSGKSHINGGPLLLRSADNGDISSRIRRLNQSGRSGGFILYSIRIQTGKSWTVPKLQFPYFSTLEWNLFITFFFALAGKRFKDKKKSVCSQQSIKCFFFVYFFLLSTCWLFSWLPWQSGLEVAGKFGEVESNDHSLGSGGKLASHISRTPHSDGRSYRPEDKFV